MRIEPFKHVFDYTTGNCMEKNPGGSEIESTDAENRC